MPDATAAAEPPLDPLVERPVSHGLRVGPNSTGSQAGAIPNSGVLVLPRITRPARRSRSTSSESNADTFPARKREPSVKRTPSISRQGRAGVRGGGHRVAEVVQGIGEADQVVTLAAGLQPGG